jgi:hypothetical protein
LVQPAGILANVLLYKSPFEAGPASAVRVQVTLPPTATATGFAFFVKLAAYPDCIKNT